jgi:hypothetical protein
MKGRVVRSEGDSVRDIREAILNINNGNRMLSLFIVTKMLILLITI